MDTRQSKKRHEIIHFLEDVTLRMKNQILSDEEERTVSQFYINMLYNKSNPSSPSEKDLMRYMTMGWYVYSQTT
jgi:hypothetical protein